MKLSYSKKCLNNLVGINYIIRFSLISFYLIFSLTKCWSQNFDRTLEVDSVQIIFGLPPKGVISFESNVVNLISYGTNQIKITANNLTAEIITNLNFETSAYLTSGDLSDLEFNKLKEVNYLINFFNKDSIISSYAVTDESVYRYHNGVVKKSKIIGNKYCFQIDVLHYIGSLTNRKEVLQNYFDNCNK